MGARTYVLKPKVWKILRASDGKPDEILIQRGLFWCLKDYSLREEDEPETGFDKRPPVG